MTFDIIFTIHDMPIDRRRVTARNPKAAQAKADRLPKLTFCTGYNVLHNGAVVAKTRWKL